MADQNPSRNYLINEKEASDYLSISTKTLQAWRVKGVGPAYFKLGRAVRYSQFCLDNFLSDSKMRSTSDIDSI